MSYQPPGNEYQYGYQDQYQPPAPRQSSGCLRGCIIAGVILLVLTAIIVGGLFWLGWKIVQGQTADPVEISKRLQERYPNARVPAGYSGVMGLRFKLIVEVDMMIFAKGDAQIGDEGAIHSGDALIVMSINVPGDDSIDQNLKEFNQVEVIEKRPHTVRVGEYEFKGSWQKVKGRQNDEHVQILVPLGRGSVVIMQGSEDGVDEAALKEFLESVAKDAPAAKKVGEKPAKDDRKEPKE